MKTKQQLFAEIQAEFEKNLKEETHWLWSRILPICLIIWAIIPAILYSQGNCINIPITIFFSFIIFGFACIILLKELENYNIARLKKREEKKLKELTKNKDENEFSMENITVPDRLPRQPVFTADSLPFWIRLGKKYKVDTDYEILSKLKDDISEQYESIRNCKIWIEVYDQTPEKNFWQYLRSKKWMKKVKGGKKS